jgi:hypothetical protein
MKTAEKFRKVDARNIKEKEILRGEHQKGTYYS